MKFLISTLLIALLSFVACLFLPWWSIALMAFLAAALIPQSHFKSFLSGFMALFILWGALCFWISSNNDHILAHRVSMLVLKMDNPYILIVITALLGALVAGFAALAASYLQIKKKPSQAES